jgi:NitT/TauT family transport system substrate-binding protein
MDAFGCLRRLAVALLILAAATARAGDEPPAVTVSLPGPGSTVSLPLELAITLGYDRAEGIAIKPRYILGGSAPVRDLQSGLSDFAMHGMPAAMLNHLQDQHYVTLMPIDDLPQYVLMVRRGLKGKVRAPRDLAGLAIGLHANSLKNKTTAHQLMELLLRGEGVASDTVRFVAQGSDWSSVSSAYRSGTIDAGLTDEPFATRLAAQGLAYPIFSTTDRIDQRRLAGAGFLRVALHGLRDRVEAQPLGAERMVRTMQRTLRWMATHTPEQIVDQLRLAGEAREAMLTVLRKNPRQYSRDGRFSTAQLRDTEVFFRAGNSDNAAAQTLSIDSMIIDRWAGRKP